MYAHLPVDVLRDVLAPIAKLVNEVAVRAEDDALIFHAVSADKTASVTATLPSEACSIYTASDQPIGVKVHRSALFLRYFSESDGITITTPPQREQFTLATTNSTYQAGWLDPSTIYQRDEPTTTETPTAAFITPSESVLLKQSLHAADLCSETITISTHSEAGVQLTATGKRDSMTTTFSTEDVLLSYGEPTRATYPIDKLLKMYEGLESRTNQFHFAINATMNLSLTASHADTGVVTRYTLAPNVTSPD